MRLILSEPGLGVADAVYLMHVDGRFTMLCAAFGEGIATAPQAWTAFMLNPIEYG